VEYFLSNWDILWSFGVYTCGLFPRFGKLRQEKSGNPGYTVPKCPRRGTKLVWRIPAFNWKWTHLATSARHCWHSWDADQHRLRYFGILLTLSGQDFQPRRKIKLHWRQGDQVGRIFACWATVSLGQLFLKITERAQIFGPTFFQGKNYVFFVKKWSGIHFGRVFFTNASGHPGHTRDSHQAG
jgi:hypothetical protein